MNERTSWRLLLEQRSPGAWNMALDEALLNRYANSRAPILPTLRLYGFGPPALSLGRSQDAWATHRPGVLRRRGIGLIRRPSGGGAVLHDRERTYSVVGLLRSDPFDGGVLATYRRIATALVTALAAVGVEARIEPATDRGHVSGGGRVAACFKVASSHEITSGGRKLVGSAQLRRRGAFLQHGSIPLRSDDRLFSESSGLEAPLDAATDLETQAGGPISGERLDAAIRAAFETTFHARLVPGTLTSRETIEATRLYAWKYCSTAWTHEGRIGERESRWVDPATHLGCS